MANQSKLVDLPAEMLLTILRQLLKIHCSGIGYLELSSCDHDNCPQDCSGVGYRCDSWLDITIPKQLADFIMVNRRLYNVFMGDFGDLTGTFSIYETFGNHYKSASTQVPVALSSGRRKYIQRMTFDSRLQQGPLLTRDDYPNILDIMILLGCAAKTIFLDETVGGGSCVFTQRMLDALLKQYNITKDLKDNDYIQELIKGDIGVKGKVVFRYVCDGGEEVTLLVYVDLRTNALIHAKKLTRPVFAYENQARFGRALD